MDATSREFRVALPWELLYADDLAVVSETEEELIKRLNEWKDNVENKGMWIMNDTKVMISGERPQGSVLAPLLFVTYITPLSTLISSCSLNQ